MAPCGRQFAEIPHPQITPPSTDPFDPMKKTTPNASGIYKISLGPRTTYYGQSQDLRHRESSHLSFLRKGTHTNRRLQSSFNKHGEAEFSFSTLLICEVADLDSYEQALLDAHHGTPGCANIAKCAVVPMRGLKHSEEAKAKISESQIGRKHSEEAKAKISESLTGRKRSEETKARMSEAQTGRKHSDEAKAKMSEALKGHEVSAEAREKISEANRKPLEVLWVSGETETFPSAKALAAHLGLKSGRNFSQWLSDRNKIPKKHNIASITRI